LGEGYALQTLRELRRRPSPACESSDEAAGEFLALVLSSRGRWLPNPGMGDAFAPTRRRIHGCGLTADRELFDKASHHVRGPVLVRHGEPTTSGSSEHKLSGFTEYLVNELIPRIHSVTSALARLMTGT
jgi:hypothetical protein